MTGDFTMYYLMSIENDLSGIYGYVKGFVIFYVCVGVLAAVAKLLFEKD